MFMTNVSILIGAVSCSLYPRGSDPCDFLCKLDPECHADNHLLEVLEFVTGIETNESCQRSCLYPIKS